MAHIFSLDFFLAMVRCVIASIHVSGELRRGSPLLQVCLAPRRGRVNVTIAYACSNSLRRSACDRASFIAGFFFVVVDDARSVVVDRARSFEQSAHS